MLGKCCYDKEETVLWDYSFSLFFRRYSRSCRSVCPVSNIWMRQLSLWWTTLTQVISSSWSYKLSPVCCLVYSL